MKKFTKFISIILAVLLLSLSIGVPVYAATTEVTTTLTTDDAIAKSDAITAKQCRYRASNNASSKHSVYAIIKYSVAGVYINDVKILLEPDTLVSGTTSYISSNPKWKIVLNPEGANTKNCIAHARLTKLS